MSRVALMTTFETGWRVTDKLRSAAIYSDGRCMLGLRRRWTPETIDCDHDVT
jgi:hypothetical protein